MIHTCLLKIVFGIAISLSLTTCKSPVDPINDENDEDPGWTYLGLKEERVHSILVRPDNPEVIFAGTGFDFSAQVDGKIFRSMDKGETWEKVYEGGNFSGLLFHPDNPDTMFAWDHRPTGGLLRSTDGGDTWHLHSNGMWTDGYNRTSVVLINPDNPQVMYAGTGGFYGGAVYKSTNGGQWWVGISTHWPDLGGSATAMFMHPDQPDLLLHSANIGTLSRTVDGGDTWERVFLFDHTVYAFAMNPENADHIIAGTTGDVGLLVSEDRGMTWRIDEVAAPSRAFIDVKFIKNSLYIATHRGILITDDFQNYENVGEKLLGYTEEGEPVYFPRLVYTLASDPFEKYLYMGHQRMGFEDEIYGGVYVRNLK